MQKKLPIGVFDSGIGGISVLNQCIDILPKENFIYYGDDANCPYGERSTDEIIALTLASADKLMKIGIKALVIACNTATGAAVEILRDKLDIPVIGIEPAIKPAVNCTRSGDVLVMATPATLSQDKFKSLLAQYQSLRQIDTLPCDSLARLIENSYGNDSVLKEYLDHKLPINRDKYGAVVLGCTHYIFIQDLIAPYFKNAEIISGDLGAAKQLKRLISRGNLSNKSGGKIDIIMTSGDSKAIELCKKLIKVKN